MSLLDGIKDFSELNLVNLARSASLLLKATVLMVSLVGEFLLVAISSSRLRFLRSKANEHF